MYLRILFNRLLPPIRRYELDIINAIASNMPSRINDIIRSQAELVNYVQRHSKNKEVRFYKIIGGESSFEGEILLPHVCTAEIISSVTIIANKSLFCHVILWQVKGLISSLEFSEPPKKLEKVKYEIQDFRSYGHIYKDSKTIEDPSDRQRLKSFLEKIDITSKVLKSIRPAMPVNDRDYIVQGLNITYPKDYSAMLDMTDGYELGEWQIFGVGNLRTVATEEYNYVMLAENASFGAIVVRRFDCTGQLYFEEYESGFNSLIGDSFVKALARGMAMYDNYLTSE